MTRSALPRQPGLTPAGVWPRFRDATITAILARGAVGGAFVVLGANKLRDPVAFLKAVHAYDILPTSPPWLLNGTAVALPWVEVLGGLAVLLGLGLRSSAALLAALTAAFTVAVAWRGHGLATAADLPLCAVRFDCGCGTGMVALCSKLAENAGLTIAALLLVATRNRRLSLWRGDLPTLD